MKPILTTASVIAIALFLSACSSTPQRPAWLDGQDSSYPAQVYLQASGQADNSEVADNRALANLAKIFEVSVADTSSDLSEASITQSNVAGSSQRQVDNKQTLSRFVNTQAQQVLRGASIAERWQDPETGQQSSLAVMKKAPAAALFMRSIRAADEQTSAAVTYAQQQASNPLSALSALDTARQRQITRLNDNNNLRVLTGNDVNVQYSVETLTKMIKSRLAALQLTTVANDKAALFALQGAAAKVGVQVVDSSRYQLELTVNQGPVETGPQWLWLRGNIVLRVLDNDSAIAIDSWAFKVAAQTEAQLEQRLQNLLVADLPGYVYQLLTPAP